MQKDVLTILKSYLNLNEKSVSLEKIKIKKISYQINSYDVANLGKVVLLSNFNKKCFILIISPLNIDAPIMVINSNVSLFNNVLSMDLYNTLIVEAFNNSKLIDLKEKYQEILLNDEKDYWYNDYKGEASVCLNTKDVFEITDDYLKTYFNIIKYTAPCDGNLKINKINNFIDLAIDNGGYLTDDLKTNYGKELVTRLYTELFKY